MHIHSLLDLNSTCLFVCLFARIEVLSSCIYSSLLNTGHYHFGDDKFIDAIFASLSPEAALLDPAKGCSRVTDCA